VFTETRVPVQTLLDYLERSSLEEFLHDFPSVPRQQALAFLEQQRATLGRAYADHAQAWRRDPERDFWDKAALDDGLE
jgi:hypothetical protein